MAIRFRCAQCKQPIEVDEELANQMARCPFCESVINVPPRSELDPQTVATARPAANDVPPPPAGLPQYDANFGVAATTPVVTKPSKYGKVALTCAVLMAMCVAGTMIRGTQLQPATNATSQPSSLGEMMEQMQGATMDDPTYVAISLGALFFSLTAVGLGLIALARKERPTWPAWVGIGSGAPFLLCQCIAGILAAFIGVAGGGI